MLKDVAILVVGDNRINQEVAFGRIQDQGAIITSVSNGKEAIEVLLGKEFDLVLMDCQMPVMDGYTATRQIRTGVAGERAKSVPIVAMTASAMAGDRERCMLSGMDDYITKPLESSELETKLVYWANQIKRNQLPILDRESLLRRVRNKPEREQELINVFSEVAPPRIRELKQAVTEGDENEISSLAHALKGSAGSLGAVRLQKLCQNLESDAQVKKVASLKHYVELLDQEFTLLMDQLETIKNEQQKTSDTASLRHGTTK